MIVERIRREIRPGTVIPKPEARADFVVKGWGRRRGQEALIYLVPNHNDPAKGYPKGITVAEWERAYAQLIHNGDFAREWFQRNLPECNEEGGCNFTTIGGVFELLGIARYERGGYRHLP